MRMAKIVLCVLMLSFTGEPVFSHLVAVVYIYTSLQVSTAAQDAFPPVQLWFSAIFVAVLPKTGSLLSM